MVCIFPYHPSGTQTLGRCFLHLEAPVARVCGADTPFPLAMEKIYLPDELKVYDAIKRTMEY